MKEYGRKPYITGDYSEMMSMTTQKAMLDQNVYSLSEMDKPYLSDSYEKQEQIYPITVLTMPGFDVPWMGISGGPLDSNLMPGKGKRPPTISAVRCTAKIGYTTTTMQVNQSQTLTVSGPPGFVYQWTLDGGGSLSAGTGMHVTYNAPGSNPGCANNALITLSMGGEICDTLTINITSNSTALAFYKKVCKYTIIERFAGPFSSWNCHLTDVPVHIALCNGALSVNNYGCFDNYLLVGPVPPFAYGPTCEDAETFYLGYYPCAVVISITPCPAPYVAGDIDELIDARTPAMIAAGCCPQPL